MSDAADHRDRSSPVNELRARLAINHFKRQVIGREHVPGQAQADAVFKALEKRAWEFAPTAARANPRFNILGWLGFRLTRRTWEGWFGNEPRIPRPSKMAALDAAARKLLGWRRPSDSATRQWPAGFYAAAVHGGLLDAMLAETEALLPSVDLLRSRARMYRPLSAWHLHLDALEVRAFSCDWNGIPSRAVVEIASLRILGELHRLWRPYDGTIYASLSSKTGRFWDVTSEEHRAWCDQYNLPSAEFDFRTEGDSAPSWLLVGAGADSPAVHVHRLLFAIGADRSFLQDDRLTAWALDLATASLAAIALALTDVDRVLVGPSFTDEKIFLSALDALLLVSTGPGVGSGLEQEAEHLREFDIEIRAAMDLTRGHWEEVKASALHDARRAYREEMADLSITASDIDKFALHATTRWRRIFSAPELPW